MLKELAHQGGTFLQGAQKGHGVTLEMVGAGQGWPPGPGAPEVIPHQLIRIQIRAVRRQLEQAQLSLRAGDERLHGPRMVRRVTVNDEEDGCRGGP